MRGLVALTTLLVVALLALADVGRVSPGPLAPVHEREPELAGLESCARCHGERGADLAPGCLACHQDVAAGIEARRGLHGTPEARAEDCGRCHTEHEGAEVAPVAPFSFALAGVPDRAAYGHANLDFGLTGRHLELECERCHRNADVPVLPVGERRFLGLDPSCTACHADVHAGAYGIDCADCHGQEHPFPRAPGFAHDARFPLRGAHASITCAECHPEGSERSVALAMAAEGRVSVRASCADCHASSHGPAFLAGVAERTGLATAETCARCHSETHESFAEPRARMTPELHALTGFPLEAPHARLDCVACHGEGGGRIESPPRRTDDCGACHADPHAAQFEGGPFAGGCRDCHDRRAFTPPSFDFAEHRRTSFPLTGAHAAVACGTCHERGPGATVSFRVERHACADCHADPHGPAFERAAVARAADEASGCARCHTTESFHAVRPGSFDHELATGWALEGGHARAACVECHRPTGGDRERELGRAAGRACADCHEDVHRGQLAGQGSPPGRTDCARCHSVTAGFAADRFDHARTRLALDEQHAKLACGACHATYALDDGTSLVRYRPLGTRCADCHDPRDPARGGTR